MPDVTVIARDSGIASRLCALSPITPTTLVLLGADQVPAALQTAADSIVLVPHVDGEVDVVGPVVAQLVAPGQLIVVGADQSSRDLAGWLSATLDLPLVWAIDALRFVEDAVEAERVVLGGSHRLVHRLDNRNGAVVSAKPAVGADSDGADRTPAAIRRYESNVPRSKVRVVETAGTDTGGVSLTGARTVISIGRGIGGPDQVPLFRELAARLDAALGASRAVVDAGWIPFSHQVGQTGTAVAPDVYAAFGISGAIQHLAGMRGAKRVVAVNTDPDAPICALADLVVRADASEVATALLQRLGGG